MIIQADGFLIRPVRDDELAAILDVYRQCEDFLALTPKPIATMEIVQEDFTLSQQNNGVFCGIYDAAGTMMGIVDVVLNGFEGDSATAFIELLMIGMPYRRTGLGSKVIAAVEAEIARDSSVSTILLAVMVNNPAAIRFWEHLGYVKCAGPLDEADGTTVWRLKKSTRQILNS